MKHSFWRIAALLCATAAACMMLTACFTTPDIKLPNPDEPSSPETVTTAPSETVPTTPTVPVPKGQLSLSLLMGVMAEDMAWSEISVYDHTDVDDTHAAFAVADGYGKECTLNVTYDAAADTVSEATLSYNDTSVNVLSDDTLVIRTIMIAMNEE